MKKFLCLFLCCVILFLEFSALADSNWICRTCDLEVSGNFCSNCGSKKTNESQTASSDSPSLTLSVIFIENLFLSTYDVALYIDNELISTLKHGEDYNETLPLTEGKHIIRFCCNDDSSVTGIAMVNVQGNTYFSCTINAHASSIDLSSISTNGEVDPEEQNAYIKNEFISSCKSIKYSKIERNPEEYEGIPIKVNGKVIQVSESYFSTATILRVKDNNGDIWYVNYTRQEGDSRVLENDRITIYGLCTGVETYSSLLDQSITVPSLDAKYIEIK